MASRTPAIWTFRPTSWRASWNSPVTSRSKPSSPFPSHVTPLNPPGTGSPWILALPAVRASSSGPTCWKSKPRLRPLGRRRKSPAGASIRSNSVNSFGRQAQKRGKPMALAALANAVNVQVTDGTNAMPTGDSTSRPIYVALGGVNYVATIATDAQALLVTGIVVTSATASYNGTTWDRLRNNMPSTPLATVTAAKATQTTDDQ